MRPMTGQIVPVNSLSHHQRWTMFKLMEQYYELVTWERFQEDLSNKDDVILLYATEINEIMGFSTLKNLKVEVDGRKYIGLFSGDTVVDRAYWGQNVLSKLFLKYLCIQKAKHPFTEMYWLLISKGYKTYLLLANNFLEHYPRYETPTPAHKQRILDELTCSMFSDYYDRETGLIQFHESLGQLRPGIADIVPEIKSTHPRIQFFSELNPTWADGSELACIGRWSFGTPFYFLGKTWWKMVGRPLVQKIQDALFPGQVEEKQA